MSQRLVTSIVLALLLSFGPGLAHAGDDGDKKKKEKEWKKLEEKQKKGGEKPGADGEGPGGEPKEGGLDGLGENPLLKILDLMKEVETRLNDTDAGEFTQEDQKKIVEAMKFEDKAKTALDDLIKKIEDMQQQQQSQSQSQSQEQDQQKKKQQQQNETPEQKKQREEQERKRQEQEKQEEQKRQRQNPQQQQQPKKPQDQQPQKQPQKKNEGKLPPDQRGPLDTPANDTRRWGDLPAKLHGDMEKARRQDPPSRWREQIEPYTESLNESNP